MARNVKISKSRLFLLGFALAMSAPGFLLGDLIRNSDQVIGLVAAIFSILAASLFAVITIVGDPVNLAAGGKMAAWKSGKSIRRKMLRYNLLFVGYLVTLGLLVAAELIETAKVECLYPIYDLIGFLTIFCFLCSITLSLSLGKVQRERLETEVESR